MKKKDWMIVLVVLIIASAFWLCNQILTPSGNETIVVTVDGKPYGTYDLEKNQTIEIHDTNRLKIQNKEADMIEADCPDKLCVHQKSISKNGESIICLPNKIVVEVKSNKKSDYDAVTN